jgi:predicted RNA polymerase sigma factor
MDQRGRDLAEEAIWLARVLVNLMPNEAEVQGVLAVMLHCEARRRARRAPDGRYVPLSEQEPQQWSMRMAWLSRCPGSVITIATRMDT